MPRRPDDESLFLRYRERGDARALARLVERTGPELLRLAAWLAGDAEAAEDLVQATWLAALERAEAYEPGRPVVPWLLGILANRARHLRRQRARRAEREREIHASSEEAAPDPTATAAQRELEERLREQLGREGPPYREVLHLHLLHGLAAHEIAAALDRPAGTVRTQLARGLERLRGRLPEGFAEGFAAAGVVLALPSPRAVAALREAVMAAASTKAGAGGALWIAGGLGMKAIGAALGALVLISALFVVSERRSDAPEQEEIGLAVSPERGDAGSDDAEQREPEAATLVEVRSALREPAPARADGATALVVRARYGEGGPPAAGALVAVAPLTGPYELLERLAWCDEGGLARFEHLDPGGYSVVAAQGGRGGATLLPGRPAECELVIPPGLRVEGRVVDPGGRAVAGARIWLSGGAGWLDAGRFVADSNDQGRFVLEHVERGRFLGAFAAGHEPARAAPLRGNGDAIEVELMLGGPARALRGEVVGPDGSPIANAAVQVGHASGVDAIRFDPREGALLSSPTLRLFTDARGRFRAEGLPVTALELPLWARAAGFAASLSHVGLAQPGELFVRVELTHGASVRGRTVDASGGPMAGARVVARPRAFEPPPDVIFSGPRWARSEAQARVDGSFELSNVPAGEVRLSAELRDLRASEELSLADGEERRWDVTLDAGGAIEGLITDARGAGLAGWCVWARGPEGAREPEREVTDASGAFRLEGCDDGEHELLACPPGMHQGLVSLAGARPGGGAVRLVVPDGRLPSAHLSGRVEETDGRPCEELWLSLTLLEDGRRANGVSRRTSGAFELGPLVPGEYEVRARPGRDGPMLDLGTHALAADQRLDLGTRRLEESGSVHLVAADEAGRPLPRGSFTLSRDGDMWASILELHGGEARSKPLQPGVYRVTPWGAEQVLVSAAVTVRPGEEARVELTLPRGVRRTVRYPRVSAPDRMFTLTWLDGEGSVVASQSSLLSNDEGPYDAAVRLRPGEYVARLARTGGASAEARFTVDDVDRPDEVLELAAPEGW